MYNQQIELINIVPFNPLISKCQIKVCWVGNEPNRNKSVITKETATQMANSLPGSPIVGYYNEVDGDFEEHNKIIEITGGKFRLKPTTRPYGFVDLGAKVWFQWFTDWDGVEREYLVTEGWLWTGQFPECQRIIDKGNNQSMELDDEIIDAHWTKDVNGNKKFFIINEAIISKLCILGEKFTPCFEGADMTAPKIEFSFEDSFKEQLFSMMTEIKNILNEGGASMENTENKVVETPVVETPVVEEPAVPAEEPVVADPVVEETPATDDGDPAPADENGSTEFVENKDDDDDKKKKVCPKCGKPIDECDCEDEDEDKDKPAKYVLEEISEYIELQNQFSELQEQFNTLKAENETLVEFKASIERKEKEEMIKGFYMLSDEDKKDVVENIDTYSLDEIEAKLSILCVRNKVSFSLDDNTNEDPIVYSLGDEGASNNEVDVPEWIKAIQAVANEN